MIRICAVLVAISCAACVPMMPQQREARITTPFVAASHAAYVGAGDATLSGQGFMRQQGGGVVTCAGSEVLLFPGSPYFEEVIRMASRGYRVPTLPFEAQGMARRTTCNAQGNFEFSGVPTGTWLVGTNVTWNVGYVQQGGALMRRVTLTSGRNEVLLSGNDFIAR